MSDAADEGCEASAPHHDPIAVKVALYTIKKITMWAVLE
jgi:hypothetical protein